MNGKMYKQYVLETVNELCPHKKRSKYTMEYYYDMFVIVLKDVNSWRSLKITKNYEGKKENHYSTIRKMFGKWNKYEIFKRAYERMLDEKVISKNKNKKEIDLFIDSTFIDNKTGKEMIGVNPLYYKKKVTKLSIVCDKDKNVIEVKPFKSTMNDCITIEETVKDIKYKKKIHLIGDKGYCAREEIRNRLLKKKIRLIVPKKKNQKKKPIKAKDRERLKERNKVENCIRMIKMYNRVSVRKDKLIINYMGFVWVAVGIILERNKIV